MSRYNNLQKSRRKYEKTKKDKKHSDLHKTLTNVIGNRFISIIDLVQVILIISMFVVIGINIISNN